MNKPTHISEETLKKFLAGELNKTEQAEFEAFLAENSFEKEAIEGIKMLSNDELKQDLQELRSKIRGKVSTKVFPYRAIAASVAVLLCSIALAWYFVKSPDITQAVDTQNYAEAQNKVQKEQTTESTKEETNPIKPNSPENPQTSQIDNLLPKKERAISSEKTEKPLMRQEYIEEAEKTMQSGTPIDDSKEEIRLAEAEKDIAQTETSKSKSDFYTQHKANEGLRKEAEISQTEQDKQVPVYNEKKEREKSSKKLRNDASPQENRALNIAKEDRFQTTPLLLQGQVMDSQSQKALANVKISVKGQKQSSFSDRSGKFSLQVPFAEKYLLVLELPKYQTLEVEAKPYEQNIFYLKK